MFKYSPAPSAPPRGTNPQATWADWREAVFLRRICQNIRSASCSHLRTIAQSLMRIEPAKQRTIRTFIDRTFFLFRKMFAWDIDDEPEALFCGIPFQVHLIPESL